MSDSRNRAQVVRRAGCATLVGVCLFAFAGCQESAPREHVVIDGSSTVFRISRAAQIGFHRVDPSVEIAVANHGTGGGFDRYFQGEVDIIDASRDAKPEETAKSQEGDLAWTRFVVGYDGITVVVNPENASVKTLTVEQLKAIFTPDSSVKTWQDLDPNWPNEKIVLYAPDTSSGTFEYFNEAIVGKGIKKHRPDVQPSPDDNQLVLGVSGDKFAIGYFGYAYYESAKTKLRAVAVQNGADAEPVLPSQETIISKHYAPLSRPLYIFVRNASLRRPGAAAFVKHYLDNADRYATSAKYVGPTDSDKAANAEAYKKAIDQKGAAS